MIHHVHIRLYACGIYHLKYKKCMYISTNRDNSIITLRTTTITMTATLSEEANILLNVVRRKEQMNMNERGTKRCKQHKEFAVRSVRHENTVWTTRISVCMCMCIFVVCIVCIMRREKKSLTAVFLLPILRFTLFIRYGV